VAISVTIAGVDQSAKVTDVSIDWKLNARSTASLQMISRDGTYRPAVGQEVIVNRAGSPIYGGSIDEFTERREWPTSAIRYDVAVVGYERRLDKRVINQICFGREFFTTNSISDIFTFTSTANPFQNGDTVRLQSAGTLPGGTNNTTTYYVVNRTGTTCQLALSAGGAPVNLTNDGSGDHWMLWTAGTAVKSLVNFYGAFEGLTVGTIEDGAGIEFTAEYARVTDIIDSLAQLSGKVWYVTGSKAVNMVARNTFSAPFNISAASNILAEPAPSFRITREEYANAVFLRISETAFGPTLTSFVGDGSRKKFALSIPIKSIGEEGVTVNGTIQTLGVYGVDSGKQWYYTPGDRWIIQDAAGVALTPAQTLFVTYTPHGLQHTFADDAAEQSARASIESGTSGKYETVQQDDSIVSQAAGDTAAAGILDGSKAIAIEGRYATYLDGLLPGQTQTINLPSHAINTSFLIDEVSARWAQAFDVDLYYTVRALSTTRLGDYLSVFKSFVGGGSSSGAALSGGSGGGGGAGGSVLIHQVALPDGPGTTTISYTPVTGSLLIVEIAQSAVGNRQIAWSADFHASSPVDIPMNASSVISLSFVEIGGAWRHFAAGVIR
jgi:hypothetical protein